MDINLKEMIKDNKVYFSRYRQNHMYYHINYNGQKYEFPVPLEDVQDATLMAEEKAIMLMRYIRKAIKENMLVKSQ